ncbi:MAG: SDR family oxidoreductase [Acidimicrobiales bacterium]
MTTDGIKSSLFDLTGKSVLVTGAGRGLGRGMALAAAAAGAQVIAVARTSSELDETSALSEGSRVAPLVWDMADLEGIDALVAKAESLGGPLHGVVHAAGLQRRKPAIELSLDDWRHVTTVDLEAPFFLSTSIHRSQLRHGLAGSHVFVGSLSSFIGLRGVSAYAASKSGLLGVVRTLALEWAPSGARVNCIAPGYFETSLTADLFADPGHVAWVRSRIPLGRIGTADDLAGALVFLLSGASAYVTGQVITVDGGWLAG